MAIESPWPGFTPVLDASIASVERRAFRRQLCRQIRNKQNTHLVREVRTGYFDDYFTDPHPVHQVSVYSQTFLEDMIDRAQTEFNALRSKGIATASTEYAVVQDDSGRFRSLAKVAIVDGAVFSTARYSDLLKPLAPIEACVNLRTALSYYDAQNGLCDVTAKRSSNFIYGTERGSRAEVSTPTLVDIEPLFYKQ